MKRGTKKENQPIKVKGITLRKWVSFFFLIRARKKSSWVNLAAAYRRIILKKFPLWFILFSENPTKERFSGRHRQELPLLKVRHGDNRMLVLGQIIWISRRRKTTGVTFNRSYDSYNWAASWMRSIKYYFIGSVHIAHPQNSEVILPYIFVNFLIK